MFASGMSLWLDEVLVSTWTSPKGINNDEFIVIDWSGMGAMVPPQAAARPKLRTTVHSIKNQGRLLRMISSRCSLWRTRSRRGLLRARRLGALHQTSVKERVTARVIPRFNSLFFVIFVGFCKITE